MATQTKAKKTKSSKTTLSPRYPGHREAYRTLYLGRLLDEEAVQYLKRNMGWSYHAPCAGHDAIQLALGSTFRASHDHLFPYYRDMITCLAGGLSAREIILNGLSREEDVAGAGRHMSNHFAKPEIHIHNVSSCVSNHAQHAVGLARAIGLYRDPSEGLDADLVERARNDHPIVYCSFGESSSSEGYVFEALNGASRNKVPTIIVMQDNGYGIGVPKHEQSANVDLAENFSGIKDLHIEYCDGQDVFDCFRAMDVAREFVESGKGPAIVYARCVRIHSHSNSDAHEQYRDRAELDAAKERDPLPFFRAKVLQEGWLSESDLAELESEAQTIFEEAKAYGEAAPEPALDTVTNNLLPPTHQPANSDGLPPEGFDGPILKMREGINKALRAYFRENPNTFMWGQDMANGKKEGIFKVTDGMQAEFGPERVFNAPIAENYITGTANGFSRFDPRIRLVIEGAEFADYLWPAMDQIVELSHEYYRTNGQFSPNVIVRVASGGGIGGGLYHSQNIEWALVSLPGIRVVQPAFADDAAGLMRTALLSEGTTIYLEPKALYNMPSAKSAVPDDFEVPFGKGRVRREGNDVSVISFGMGVHHAMKAAAKAEEMGISVEVFDLRSLSPLDSEGIAETIRKTNRAVVVHEDKVFGGFGGEVVAQITQDCFEYLDAPIERIGQAFIPVPFNRHLEAAMQPTPDHVLAAIQRAVNF